MKPLLELLSDGGLHKMREVTATLAHQFGLSDDERRQLLPSGLQPIFSNRVGWARTYLKKAGLLESPSRGVVRITDAGRTVLASKPAQVNDRFLKQFPSFVEFKEVVRTTSESSDTADEPDGDDLDTATPEESLLSSYRKIREALADELLDRVKSCSPAFFEKLVVELLVAMGYGGSEKEAGQRVGRTGDNGIDGIIKEDKLGLDVVCIQAKRWEKNVGRPEVQAFAGSMEGFRARKGVLLTTSGFSKDAEQYVSHIERKIVLIDGQRLAELMIDYNIGVETRNTIVIKRMDSDYFDEVDD